jgi:hypothetical protein
VTCFFVRLTVLATPAALASAPKGERPTSFSAVAFPFGASWVTAEIDGGMGTMAAGVEGLALGALGGNGP